MITIREFLDGDAALKVAAYGIFAGGPGSGRKPGDDQNDFDEAGQIAAYERGDLDGRGTIELFQHLVDNGRIWQLPASYGRMAERLLQAGVVSHHDKSLAHFLGR